MTFRRGGAGGGRGRFGGREDRSRPGGRDAGPPRSGDRLSNHTSDASMANARIFVGKLPTNDSRLTKELLEESFSKFGHILGISILKGFGFIQYAEEASAETAIRESQNLEILGHRLDVKNVKTGKDAASTSGNGAPAPSNEPSGYRDRSPLRRRDFDMPPMRDREPDMPARMRDADMGMRGGPTAREMDRAAHDFDDRSRDWGRERDMLDPYHADPYMERHPREPYPPPMSERGFGAAAVPRPGGLPMPNDVEIIVTSKVGPMRQYSELLESRIRAHGMAVDVLFPREDIPIRQVLMDLSERGTLFAFVLTPLNEEHRSVTLNILFGPQPEEHRNMPLEDAFGLLTSTFQRYQQQRAGGGATGRPDDVDDANRAARSAPPQQQQQAPPSDAHPPSMQTLIDLLQANRPLSIMEYDRLIRYLGDRRDRQANEDARAGPSGAASSQSYMKGYNTSSGAGQDNPMELQQRILSILNSAGSGGGVAGVGPVPAPVPAPGSLSASWSGQVGDAGVQSAYGAGLSVPGRQPDRSMAPPPVQQPGGYYGMGNRF